jgi:uncharacterized membrane protein YhaH (DUF805 family)
MGFVDAVSACFRNYVGFSGRASRPEYWWFALFVFVGAFVANLIDRTTFGSEPGGSAPITGFFQLAVLLPVLAAGWRRMQDTSKPGWYILIPFLLSVIFAGGMLLGVFGFGLLELGGAGPETLAGPALMLGGGGMIVAAIVQVVVVVVMIWWLTRPGDPGANRYGPPPAR